jgi:hypothetical protein
VQEECQAEVETVIAVNFFDVSQEVDHPENCLVGVQYFSWCKLPSAKIQIITKYSEKT